MKKLIDVYIYRINKENIPEFLFMKRAKNKMYPGQWRLVHGKVEEGEKYWEAAIREFREETQLKPIHFWAVPTINSFYEPQTDQIHHIPAFAIQVEPGHDPILNEEHTDFKWDSIRDIEHFMTWPEQKRLLRTVNDIVVNHIIQHEWVIDLE